MTMLQAVSHDPDILGGTLCFAGTRVPVRSLFDYLEGGNSIDYYLDSFNWITREQVVAVLEHSARKLEEEVDTISNQ